jgi:chitinase
MRRFIALAYVLSAFLLGCGGSSGEGGAPPPTPAVTLSVNPSSVNLAPSATQAFSATVSGSTQTAVTWSVVEAGGGSVNTAGLYTAPGLAA